MLTFGGSRLTRASILSPTGSGSERGTLTKCPYSHPRVHIPGAIFQVMVSSLTHEVYYSELL